MSHPLDLLTQAQVTLALRGATYGSYRKNFGRIAAIWTAILGQPVTEVQVAACLVGLKLARLGATPGHADSWLDIVGYGALGGALASPDDRDEDFDNIGEV